MSAPWAHQSDMPTLVVLDISSRKRAPVDMLAPNNNRGMTYHTNEKSLNNMVELNYRIDRGLRDS
jgi:hypothetical protein